MHYRIAESKCSGCWTCLDSCPTEAIERKEGRAFISLECIDCGACIRICPEGAIKQVVPERVKKLR